jgi:predicted peptidase
VKRVLLVALTAAVGWVCPRAGNAEEPVPGRQVAQQIEVPDGHGGLTTLHYWLFLPRDYPEKKTSPLMLFLHGAGERGDDLQRVKKWGPPRIVEDDAAFPFVLVSPQTPAGRRWVSDQLAPVIEHVATRFKIDRRRISVTGLSMGGYGTWAMATRYPDLFAAAAPICGGGDPGQAGRLKDLPIWAFHGGADPGVPVQHSQEMVDAIQRLGGRAKLTIYPGVGHNSWSRTYADPEFYDWLLAQQRRE